MNSKPNNPTVISLPKDTRSNDGSRTTGININYSDRSVLNDMKSTVKSMKSKTHTLRKCLCGLSLISVVLVTLFILRICNVLMNDYWYFSGVLAIITVGLMKVYYDNMNDLKYTIKLLSAWIKHWHEVVVFHNN